MKNFQNFACFFMPARCRAEQLSIDKNKSFKRGIKVFGDNIYLKIKFA